VLADTVTVTARVYCRHLAAPRPMLEDLDHGLDNNLEHIQNGLIIFTSCMEGLECDLEDLAEAVVERRR